MTKIEWADETWNPVVGCSRVSEGCRHCYAERQAATRLKNVPAYEGTAKTVAGDPRWTGVVNFLPERLDQPLRWKRPRRVFVNSMSDLFHEGLSNEQIAAVFGVMAAAPNHQFLVLTKRPKRALEWFEWVQRGYGTRHRGHPGDLCRELSESFGVPSDPTPWVKWPLPNVWLGVSVEDQLTADKRIPLLLQCPASVRWVSYEPALGPVDFTGWVCGDCHRVFRWSRKAAKICCGHCEHTDEHAGGIHRPVLGRGTHSARGGSARGLDWIVVGGESGPGARSCSGEWILDTVRQCGHAEVPVFVKQLGADFGWSPDRGEWVKGWANTSAEECGYTGVRRLCDRKGGDWSEWPKEFRVREWPQFHPLREPADAE